MITKKGRHLDLKTLGLITISQFYLQRALVLLGDARATSEAHGLSDAIYRAHRYIEAGADASLVETQDPMRGS